VGAARRAHMMERLRRVDPSFDPEVPAYTLRDLQPSGVTRREQDKTGRRKLAGMEPGAAMVAQVAAMDHPEEAFSALTLPAIGPRSPGPVDVTCLNHDAAIKEWLCLLCTMPLVRTVARWTEFCRRGAEIPGRPDRARLTAERSGTAHRARTRGRRGPLAGARLFAKATASRDAR